MNDQKIQKRTPNCCSRKIIPPINESPQTTPISERTKSPSKPILASQTSPPSSSPPTTTTTRTPSLQPLSIAATNVPGPHQSHLQCLALLRRRRASRRRTIGSALGSAAVGSGCRGCRWENGRREDFGGLSCFLGDGFGGRFGVFLFEGEGGL